MNKAELIEAVAYQSGETKKLSAKMVDCLLSAIEGELSTGGEVMIVGFGKFAVYERAARTGRNPRTGEPMEIVARRAVHFKVGKNLQEAV
jgi:DNA-binding protein HU-beta